MKKMISTLLLLRRGNEILLAQKKRGFGSGKYNGIGGKLEIGETVEEAMIRECQEEIFVTPLVYEKYAVNEFSEYLNGEQVSAVFHLYVATKWEGEPRESEEMKPEWFSLDRIPYDLMFSDDKYWLPLVLQDKKLECHFEFDSAWNLLSHHIVEVQEVK